MIGSSGLIECPYGCLLEFVIQVGSVLIIDELIMYQYHYLFGTWIIRGHGDAISGWSFTSSVSPVFSMFVSFLVQDEMYGVVRRYAGGRQELLLRPSLL